jgi:hypothetical protein
VNSLGIQHADGLGIASPARPSNGHRAGVA